MQQLPFVSLAIPNSITLSLLDAGAKLKRARPLDSAPVGGFGNGRG